MANIAEDYVSPSLRWGIFKQDHPAASVKFHAATGAELGIPKQFGGDEDYCVATICCMPGDPSPIVGYKPVADAKGGRGDHVSDAWNILCTKALGRAIKRAGYPDTTEDLRVFVLYKQRLAEHEAIRVGVTLDEPAALPAGSPEPTALEMSGVGYPAAVEGLIQLETKDDSDDVVEAVIIDAEEVTEVEAAFVEEKDEWNTAWDLEAAHEELKNLVGEMDEEHADRARAAHTALNGRMWPIKSVSQFNTLLAQVKTIHGEYEASLDDEIGLPPDEAA